MTSEVDLVMTNLPELVSSIGDAAKAANSALTVSTSATNAFAVADDTLSISRIRRAEALQSLSRAERSRAEQFVGRLLDALQVADESYSHVPREHITEFLPRTAWKEPMESWWLEKVIGLRWRLGSLSDALVETYIKDEDRQSYDYVESVRLVANRWGAVSRVLQELLSWIEEWKGVACLAREGCIGEKGVLVRKP
jgi:hypothetical protein